MLDRVVGTRTWSKVLSSYWYVTLFTQRSCSNHRFQCRQCQKNFAMLLPRGYSTHGEPIKYELRSWDMVEPLETSRTARLLACGLRFSPFGPESSGAPAHSVPLLPAACIASTATEPSRAHAQMLPSRGLHSLPAWPVTTPDTRKRTPLPRFLPSSIPSNTAVTWSPPESSPTAGAVAGKAAASNAPRPVAQDVPAGASASRPTSGFGALVPNSEPPSRTNAPSTQLPPSSPVSGYLSSDDILVLSSKPAACNASCSSNSKNGPRELQLEITYLNDKREDIRIKMSNNVLRWDDLPYLLREHFRMSPDPISIELRWPSLPTLNKAQQSNWTIFGTTSHEVLNPEDTVVAVHVVNRTHSFMVVDKSQGSRKKRAAEINTANPAFFEDDTPPQKKNRTNYNNVKKTWPKGKTTGII